jgi:hypothetical protein
MFRRRVSTLRAIATALEVRLNHDAQEVVRLLREDPNGGAHMNTSPNHRHLETPLFRA